MKVSELIELLNGFDQEAPVHFAYCYGDHWRTQVAPKVSEVYDGKVTFSDYHRMDKLVEDRYDYDEEDEDGEGGAVNAVIIG